MKSIPNTCITGNLPLNCQLQTSMHLKEVVADLPSSHPFLQCPMQQNDIPTDGKKNCDIPNHQEIFNPNIMKFLAYYRPFYYNVDPVIHVFNRFLIVEEPFIPFVSNRL